MSKKLTKETKLEIAKEYLELALLTSNNPESSKFYLDKANDQLQKIKKDETNNMV